ncbi:hypothetical protein [Haloimpatiens massiliensis]|uniref:hypothetical protein n=1 Tax=Haloimpatiens massiliensis TaxID=1658110 RepID=UPI000C8438FE|nr:hypothetical protein [Haloimpatiens massiliensis]
MSLINKDEIKKYPICDTDIWVKLCLAGIENKVFKKYGKLIVADVVAQEISAWNNESRFNYIYTRFKQKSMSGDIIVIHHQNIEPEEDRMILEMQLYQYKFKTGFKNIPKEKHKGEFVSAIYADYFNIPFLKSNDSTFKPGERGRKEFPDLKVKNWYDTTNELISEVREKIKLRAKVETLEKVMEEENEIYKKHGSLY